MTSAGSFLRDAFAKQSYQAHVVAAVEMATGGLNSLVTRVKSEQLKIPEMWADFGDMILQLEKNMMWADVERNVRAHNLIEANRRQQQLADKLQQVDATIGTLRPREVVKPKRVSLLDSKVRHAYFEEEKKRRKETTQKSVKLQKEQQARKLKEEEEKEKRRLALEELEKAEAEAKKQAEDKAKEDYNKKLEEKKARAEARKAELAEQAEAAKRGAKAGPLFKQIERKFEMNVNMPELEKRKKVLAEKRELARPIRQKEIRQHMQSVDAAKAEKERARKQAARERSMESAMINNQLKNYDTQFKEDILEEEYIKKETERRALSQRFTLAEKKARYSDLVREMYTPVVDKMKSMEIEIIKEKLKHPVRAKAQSRAEPTMQEYLSEDNYSMEKLRARSKPARWKPNSMIPAPTPKREPKVIDYLSDRRKERQDNSSEANFKHKRNLSLATSLEAGTGTQSPDALRKKANLVDLEARRHELVLAEKDSQDPEAIKAKDELHDMYIGSIKAKLALLEAD